MYLQIQVVVDLFDHSDLGRIIFSIVILHTGYKCVMTLPKKKCANIKQRCLSVIAHIPQSASFAHRLPAAELERPTKSILYPLYQSLSEHLSPLGLAKDARKTYVLPHTLL